MNREPNTAAFNGCVGGLLIAAGLLWIAFFGGCAKVLLSDLIRDFLGKSTFAALVLIVFAAIVIGPGVAIAALGFRTFFGSKDKPMKLDRDP